MKFAVSDENLEKVLKYFTRPVLFYLAASLCWVWLESDDNFGYLDAMALPGMVALGIYWDFSAPQHSRHPLQYQWFTYYVPILLAVLGLLVWSLTSQA